jgi:copper homeostasis protein
LITLEVCADSAASAVAAQKGGAKRVELCDNLHDGGTTPSYGAIMQARDNISIGLYPIIRPRGGDFLYEDHEFEVMMRDIACCKKAGCDGVVIGMLTAAGDVDVPRTRLLAEQAWPMGVTFHRAFDRCRDPLAALEDVISTGAERILTSGQGPTARDGAAVIARLVEKAAGRIAIMAGSGVRASGIAELVRATGCTEYHSRAQGRATSKMSYRNALVEALGAPETTWEQTDPREVAEILLRAEKAWQEAFGEG